VWSLPLSYGDAGCTAGTDVEMVGKVIGKGKEELYSVMTLMCVFRGAGGLDIGLAWLLVAASV
jgi:hypothetical protein